VLTGPGIRRIRLAASRPIDFTFEMAWGTRTSPRRAFLVDGQARRISLKFAAPRDGDA
jgi:hypothetical protein